MKYRLFALTVVCTITLAPSAFGQSSRGGQQLVAGSAIRDCPTCPEMIVVAPGTFSMGSPQTESGRSQNEGPQKSISLGRPFAVGKFSVTFEEWDACVSAGSCQGYKPEDAGWGRSRMPVINVSWHDANAYVTWLSKTTGRTYRLPTEAEREYVTRAGSTSHFSWGTNIRPALANYNHRFNDRYGGELGDPPERTVPVDRYAPNPWGFHNLHGNVWEWTADCWPSPLSDKPSDGSADSAEECDWRAVRGGSFSDFPLHLRSASRLGFKSVSRGMTIGFRVALTIE